MQTNDRGDNKREIEWNKAVYSRFGQESDSMRIQLEFAITRLIFFSNFKLVKKDWEAEE